MRRQNRTFDKILKETTEDLMTARENLMKKLYEAKDEAEKIALHSIQVRKDFIEQSELATEWRQKHDRLKIDYTLLKDESDSVQNLNNEFHAEILNLESELDRGNEMITWMKADLAKAHELNRKNEMAIMYLLINGKFPDEKGVYRKNYLTKKGEDLPLGQYIDSLYRSRVSNDQFNSFPKAIEDWTSDLSQKIDNAEEKLEEDFNETSESKIAEGVLKFNFPTEYVGLTPINEPLHDFEKIADQATQPLADAIDWNVPQAFPEWYVIPKGVDVICIKENPWVKEESTGKTKEDSCSPYIDWNGENYHKNGHGHWNWSLASSYIAPINPADHPLHPDFGKEKEEGYKIASGNGYIDEPNAPQIINPINLP